MPTFAGRPSTSSSLILVDIPQNSMVGQQRQQISKLQFDKFPDPQLFLVWEIRFENQVTTCETCCTINGPLVHLTICTDSASVVLSLLHICSLLSAVLCAHTWWLIQRTHVGSSVPAKEHFVTHAYTRHDIVICLSLPLFWFSIGCNIMDQRRWRWAIQWMNWSPRDQICGQEFPEFWNAGREDCFCSEQDLSEFPIEEEDQSRGTESPERGTVFYEEDRSPSWFATTFEIAFMIYDYFRVTGTHDTVLD